MRDPSPTPIARRLVGGDGCLEHGRRVGTHGCSGSRYGAISRAAKNHDNADVHPGGTRRQPHLGYQFFRQVAKQTHRSTALRAGAGGQSLGSTYQRSHFHAVFRKRRTQATARRRHSTNGGDRCSRHQRRGDSDQAARVHHRDSGTHEHHRQRSRCVGQCASHRLCNHHTTVTAIQRHPCIGVVELPVGQRVRLGDDCQERSQGDGSGQDTSHSAWSRGANQGVPGVGCGVGTTCE